MKADGIETDSNNEPLGEDGAMNTKNETIYILGHSPAASI
jgi:hypothetical protein